MKKRILHILVGTATVLGCYSSLMAAEVGIVNGNAKAYVSPEENAKFSLNVYEGEEVAWFHRQFRFAPRLLIG